MALLSGAEEFCANLLTDCGKLRLLDHLLNWRSLINRENLFVRAVGQEDISGIVLKFLVPRERQALNYICCTIDDALTNQR